MKPERFFPTELVTRQGDVQTAIADLGQPVGVLIHARPMYTPREAQQVADWLNGKDQPLNIVARSVDTFDPVRIQARRVK